MSKPAGVRGHVVRLAFGEPLPPLGPFPLPAELPVVRCGQLLPGEGLFLHTDGVEDARDAQGRFFLLLLPRSPTPSKPSRSCPSPS